MIGALVLLAQTLASHAQPAAASEAGGLAWTAPKSWTVAPAHSSMRVVTYQVAAEGGDKEPAEVAVFYFGPGQGGGTQANIDRWVRQFAAEKGAAAPGKPVTKKIGDIAVTTVTAEGTYDAGMPGMGTGPRPGWALRGAIADAPGGSVFFKMVGPKKTVLNAAPEFDAMLRSLKKAG